MGHHGGETPKPEKGWTNHVQFAKLDQGKMDYKTFKSSIKTVKKTVTKNGKSSYCGTKDLKSTQSGACLLYIILIFSEPSILNQPIDYLQSHMHGL